MGFTMAFEGRMAVPREGLYIFFGNELMIHELMTI
jgi:hypothetical protein